MVRSAIFLHQGARDEGNENEDNEFDFVVCQSHGRRAAILWRSAASAPWKGKVSVIESPGFSFRRSF
jgi:hypothetical protein